MLITRFNKMIRNRLIWAGFAVVIVIAFVGVFSPDVGSGSRRPSSGVARLYGDEVSPAELSMARFFVMGMRDARGLSEEFHERITAEAWRRIATLKTAQRMGIRATDAEVARQIQNDPTFAVNGQFSPERYRAVIQSQWRASDSVPTFEEYVRQEVILRKLAALLECAVWVPPTEVSERMASLTDEFTVQCVALPPETNAAAALDTEALQAFYEAHTNVFVEPARTRVRYVAFPVAEYRDGISVSQAKIGDYYTNNLQAFAITNADGMLSYRGLAEVSEAVSNALVAQGSAFEARDDAVRFVMMLAPDRAGRAPTFEAAAADSGLAVHTSAYFAAYEDVPGLEVDRAFNRAAFRLDASDPEAYFSDAVSGTNAAYVLAALDSIDSYVPAFTDIVARVRLPAETAAAETAALEHAAALRSELESALDDGRSFEQAVAQTGLNVATSCTFAAYSREAEDVPHAETLIPEVIGLQAGEITRPLETAEGYLLAYVAARVAPAYGSAALPRNEVLAALNRYRASVLFADWQDDALKQARFEDLRPAPGANGTDSSHPDADAGL